MVAALKALLAFLKKTHHINIRWNGSKYLNSRLAAMSTGWGGKEEVGRREALVG